MDGKDAGRPMHAEIRGFNKKSSKLIQERFELPDNTLGSLITELTQNPAAMTFILKNTDAKQRVSVERQLQLLVPKADPEPEPSPDPEAALAEEAAGMEVRGEEDNTADNDAEAPSRLCTVRAQYQAIFAMPTRQAWAVFTDNGLPKGVPEKKAPLRCQRAGTMECFRDVDRLLLPAIEVLSYMSSCVSQPCSLCALSQCSFSTLLAEFLC